MALNRTSMTCGLKVRSSLLDYKVAEWSWHLPLAMKHRDGQAGIVGPLRRGTEGLLSRDWLARQGPAQRRCGAASLDPLGHGRAPLATTGVVGADAAGMAEGTDLTGRAADSSIRRNN
ncbi:MAG: hypothetical protein J5I81_12490 [Nitrococcus mobilis]|nr:hypothetical protein [Nitrococcus mobilis]